jgi:flagellar motor switch protein FliN
MTTQTVDTSVAVQAATLASAVLPSVQRLTVAAAQPGTDEVGREFPGVVVAKVAGHPTARVAVLVGDELVEALASSPTPGLELAAAVQPAVDALATAVGGSADAAVEVEPATLAASLGGPFTVVPLIGAGAAAAVAITNDVLVARVTEEPAPFSTSTTAATANTPVVDAGVVTHQAAGAGAPRRGIEMLAGVDMELTVELGRTRMAVRDLLALAPGDVLELDRAAGSPADLLVNGRLIARGEVVVVDEDFGLRITQILDSSA